MIKKSILKTYGITFKIVDKEYHTSNDLDLLWLAELEISSPEAKLHIIDDIQGADGILDITKQFGAIRFKNRSIIAQFEARDADYNEWHTICSNVHNKLHGQKAEIIMDTDPNYYWEGRLSISPVKESMEHSKIEISMDVFPYKRKVQDSKVEKTINQSNKTVAVTNSRMPSEPIITVSSAVSLLFNGETYSLKSGDNSPDIEFIEGENLLTFTGQSTNVNVIVQWKEGSL